MATRSLVVWCPDWPVTAAGYGPQDPVAVVHANRVMACSAAARHAGIRRGLRRREAQAACPQAAVIEHDPGRDARAFEPLVAAVEAFAVGVEILRPGLCVLATRGPSRYFGGDEKLAAKIGDAVGDSCRTGVADGVFTAIQAARQTFPGAGVTIVAPGESAAFLAPLPVSALEQPDLTGVLARLGILTLGAFAALPSTAVLDRFGWRGAQAHRLARGLDERPLAIRQPPADLGIRTEIDPPALQVEQAAFIAKTMSQDLDRRLRHLGLVCTRIGVEAETEHGERHARLWRHDGGLTPRAVAQRVRWQLDGWLSGADRPTAGITLLRLVPDQVHPAGDQLGLWARYAQNDERAVQAIARIQGMLGFDAVVVGVPAGGRGPGEQLTAVAWDEASPNAQRKVKIDSVDGGMPWPGRIPSPYPATVYQQPLPARLSDSGGHPVEVTGRSVLTAAPHRLAVNSGPWRAISAWAGPWPADERWWDAADRRRRARFQILTDEAAWLVAIDGGRWWVDALYD